LRKFIPSKSITRGAYVVEVLADAISTPISNADTAINKILSSMGILSGVDRAYVFQRKFGDLLDNTHEWCRDGVEPMIERLQNMSMDIIAPWRAAFEQGEILHVPRVDDMALDPSIRDLLAMQGIRGILLVPLQFDGRIVGFVGFDRVKAARPFSAEVVRILTAISGAVGTILARAEADREIVRTRTKLESAVRELHFMAMNDHLTGAPNRRAFHHSLTEALHVGDLQGSETCLAMIDLVRFKSINENHGHVVGDHLLKRIVDRWNAIATDGAQLFRVGGDEFAIVFRGTNAKQRAESAIALLRNALVEPFFPDHQNIRVEISVGLSVAPRDGQVADTLAAAADLALLSSKIVNGKTYWYSPELRNRAIQRHETIQDLLAADVEKDFKVFFQPIIDLKTGAIVKVEALLRWAHPRHGLLLPSNFIEALCSLNRSRAVGRRILEEACAITASWNRRFSLNLIVSVNAFPLQLVDPDFPKDVQAALSKSNLPARCLEIEVTENIALERDSYSRTVLQQLSDMSVAISLDDFGTGFASLSSLIQLKIQTLKIDRSFAVNLSPSDPRMVILKATQLMTNGLGIRTVVEGIENVDVARIVCDLGFDYAQGYFWSLPIDPEAFSKLLTSQQVMRLFANPTAS